MLSPVLDIRVLEDDLHSLQTGVGQAPPRQGGAVGLRGADGQAEIDQAVGGEIRVQGNVQEPSLAIGQDRRQTGDRLRLEMAIAEPAQASRPFRDQGRAIREPGDTPGVLQIPGQHLQGPTLGLGHLAADRGGAGVRVAARRQEEDQA